MPYYLLITKLNNKKFELNIDVFFLIDFLYYLL